MIGVSVPVYKTLKYIYFGAVTVCPEVPYSRLRWGIGVLSFRRHLKLDLWPCLVLWLPYCPAALSTKYNLSGGQNSDWDPFLFFFLLSLQVPDSWSSISCTKLFFYNFLAVLNRKVDRVSYRQIATFSEQTKRCPWNCFPKLQMEAAGLRDQKWNDRKISEL